MSFSDRMQLQAARRAAELQAKVRALTVTPPRESDVEARKRRKASPKNAEKAAQRHGALRAMGEELSATAASIDSTNYFVVTDMANMRILARDMAEAEYCALDMETTSLDFRHGQICGLSTSLREGEAFYIPLYHPLDKEYCLPVAEVVPLLRPVIESTRLRKAGANLGGFDSLWWLHHWGLDLQEPIDDIQIMYNLLDPRSLDELKLKLLTLILLKIKMPTYEETVGYVLDDKGKRVYLPFDRVPLEKSYIYACCDADMTLRDRHVIAAQLSKYPRNPSNRDEGTLLDYYYEIEDGIIRARRDMYMTGMGFNASLLTEADKEVTGLLRDYETKVYASIGAPINLGSAQQLRTYLYERGEQQVRLELKETELAGRPEAWRELWRKHRLADEMAGKKPNKNYSVVVPLKGLGLKVMKKTKTKEPSTDKEALEALADEYPELTMLDDLAEWKKLSTIHSNFTGKLPDLVNPDTGRIHGELNQTGVETGRFSMSNPNLQQLTKPKDVIDDDAARLGQLIRAAFIAPVGRVVVPETLGWQMLHDYSETAKDGKVGYPARELFNIVQLPDGRYEVPARFLDFCDFSQIELRVAAWYSGDEGMRYAFEHGVDIHLKTASDMYGIALENVNKDLRKGAKAINFGIWYGMMAKALARRLKITVAEAERLLAA